MNNEKLLNRIRELENENAILKRDFTYLSPRNSVSVPETMKPLFDIAEQTVNSYFRNLKMDPSQGTISINDQRYVLVRASALSKDFLDTIQKLYSDRGESEALAIGRNFLFDIAHVIGMNDAKNFHTRMCLTDPVAKLSAGPVHFAYSGWAYVDILPESTPSPDENCFLIYHHPYSFEADSWIQSGKKSDTPVCIMNAGYSSGWCEESFGISLTAVELSCTAKGDQHCTFIMAPPNKIQQHIDRFHTKNKEPLWRPDQYEIPTFFERKKVEEEMKKSKLLAEESAKSKSDFIANMSHELRTPLGAILGFTDLMKKTNLNSVQSDYLEAIKISGNNLLSIINDVLDLSKLDAGKFIIESLPFNINELLQSVHVMLSSKAKKKNLQFECKTDPAITYTVVGDPMRLTQILVNLIGNAIKFTEKGGVYVSCTVVEENENTAIIQFNVRDTGIGIPDSKAGLIFERFTQADTNITREYGGTGLGLAISKQLIELQGGNIHLNSNYTSGSEFLIRIPFLKSSHIVQSKFHQESEKQILFKNIRNILLVEDNLMNQKLASVILKNNGFEVTVAEHGKKAIEILTEEHFDLILMDIQMPTMDGYQATQAIRNELQVSTPIIAMTAHALSGEREKCLDTGMNDYLSKPFKENELLEKIAKWENDIDATPTLKGIINLSFLKEQTHNNNKFILEMITIFKEHNPKDILALHNAISEVNYKDVFRLTHTIRNTIAYFGLEKYIGDILLTMENLSKAEIKMDEISIQFKSVSNLCKQAIQELDSMDLSNLDS